jgi:hypothetical protein
MHKTFQTEVLFVWDYHLMGLIKEMNIFKGMKDPICIFCTFAVGFQFIRAAFFGKI